MANDRPTITTVAERARVSRQTVSNVLNAPHRVQPETQQRVRAAIAELGYRPHRAARQLRTHRSNLIAMRMAPFSEDDAGSVLDRFVHAVTESGERFGFPDPFSGSAGWRRRFYAENDPYARDSQIKPEWDRVLDRLGKARAGSRKSKIARAKARGVSP